MMQFSSEIIDSLQFSDGFALSWHELNAIVLYLERLTGKLEFLYSCIFVLFYFCCVYDSIFE